MYSRIFRDSFAFSDTSWALWVELVVVELDEEEEEGGVGVVEVGVAGVGDCGGGG